MQPSYCTNLFSFVLCENKYLNNILIYFLFLSVFQQVNNFISLPSTHPDTKFTPFCKVSPPLPSTLLRRIYLRQLYGHDESCMTKYSFSSINIHSSQMTHMLITTNTKHDLIISLIFNN